MNSRDFLRLLGVLEQNFPNLTWELLTTGSIVGDNDTSQVVFEVADLCYRASYASLRIHVARRYAAPVDLITVVRQFKATVAEELS